MARNMKYKGLIEKTFFMPNGLTYVVPKGSTDKVRIYDTEDLEQFADGRDMNEFDVSYADLEEV